MKVDGATRDMVCKNMGWVITNLYGGLIKVISDKLSVGKPSADGPSLGKRRRRGDWAATGRLPGRLLLSTQCSQLLSCPSP